MVGEPYVIYVKQRLNDYPDGRTQLGELYGWGEILACLNACLLHFVHLCLSKNAYVPLTGLLRTTTILATPYPVSNLEGFLWVRGAQVFHSRRSRLETARWLGASGSVFPYLYSRANCCAIVNGNIVMVDDEKQFVGGVLEYYVYPSLFSLATENKPDYLTKDMPDWVYVLVAECTVAMLGMKDGQGPREANAWQLWWERLNETMMENIATAERSILHSPEAPL
jgi:uncharacterized cupin superfamily protein